MEVGDQRHAPATLPPGKRPVTHCIGGWVGPSASWDRYGKSCPPPGFDPWTVQPVASHYAICAILVHNYPVIYIYIYIYIQGVPGGMCQTSGGYSLC